MSFISKNRCSKCEKLLEPIWIEVKGTIENVLCNKCFNEKYNSG